MPRRRKSDDLLIVRAAAGIAVGLTCLCILNPNFRNALLGIGIILFALVFIFIIGILIYQFARKKRSDNYSPAFSATKAPTSTPAMDPDLDQERYMPPPDYAPRSAKPEVKPIDRLRDIDWYQFERFVAYVYEQHGFNVTRKGGANPDGGIDMVIEKNGQRFAVQCKHWKTWDVGVKAIREFLGALTDSKIEKGIFITLNEYTGEAKQLAEKHGIEIINETGLRRMVEALDLRNPKVQEIFSDTRKICPKCERPLVLRTARKGPNAGGQFWGCSGFPQGCTFKMAV
ncbi:MAG TPA: restriction endonuclease [Candidatus Acidoferrales bacterium]|jgi:hypothetical protein|nr:restriction endonuclease [Candidatus Acidoferrales bacterium]